MKFCAKIILRRFLSVYFLLVLSAGCVSQGISNWSTDGLIKAVGNRELADRQRLAVIEAVLDRSLDPNQQVKLGEEFSRVIASPLHSPVIRRRVLEVIAGRYHDEAAAWLGAALLQTQEEQLRRQIIDILVQLNDKRVLADLVLALAQEQGGDGLSNELVGGAIERITGRPLAEVLEGQMADGDNLQVRIAALAALVKQAGFKKALEMVSKTAGEDETSQVLRFWSERFSYLPTNIARFMQCRWRQGQSAPEQMAKLQGRVEMLQKREGYRFNIRDSFLVLTMDEKLLELNRGQLIRQIEEKLVGLDHTKRPASYRGAIDDYAEDFQGQKHTLDYCDLMRINLLLSSFKRLQVQRQMGEFLRHDLEQIASEVGGLCFLGQDGIIFKEYQPGQSNNDNQYVETLEMIQDSLDSVARWHCHTDRWRGRELAGPGADDMRYADWQDCPVVIITYIDNQKYNVDFLTPEGVVIDLGNYALQ